MSPDSHGSTSEEDLIFTSSPALEALQIPQTTRSGEFGAVEPAVAVAPPPAKPGSSLAWPIALVLTAAIAAGVYLYLRKVTTPPPVADVPTAPRMAAATPAPAAAKTEPDPEPKATPEPPKDPVVEPAPAAAAAPASNEKPHPTKAKVAKHHAKRTGKRHAAAKTAGKKPSAAVAAATPKSKPKKGKGDALDNLIDDALGDSPKPKVKAKAAAKPKENLPKVPTQSDIRRGMNKVKGRVQGCYDKYQVAGTAKVWVEIVGATGKPSSVKIKGKFFGTDTGKCVAKAVRRARFPRFSKTSLSIKFPFTLSD